MPINQEEFQRLKTQPMQSRKGGKKVNWDNVKRILKESQEKGDQAHSVDEIRNVALKNLSNGADNISRMRVRGFLERECVKKRAEVVFDGVRKYYRIR